MRERQESQLAADVWVYVLIGHNHQKPFARIPVRLQLIIS